MCPVLCERAFTVHLIAGQHAQVGEHPGGRSEAHGQQESKMGARRKMETLSNDSGSFILLGLVMIFSWS